MKKSFLTLAIGLLTLSAIGQNSKLPSIDMKEFQDGVNHWYGIKDKTNLVDPVPNQPVYSLNQIVEIADNVLLFQRNNGGWPKNYDMKAVLTPEQKQKVIEECSSKSLLNIKFMTLNDLKENFYHVLLK